MNIELKVDGMTCSHCQAAVTKALKSVPGVRSATVDLRQAKATVEGDALDVSKLIAAVQTEGYQATPAQA